MLGAVILVEFRNFGLDGFIRVGVGEKRADRLQNFSKRDGRRPLIAQDAQEWYHATVKIVNLTRQKRQTDKRKPG